jgi:hypothetical protein
MPALSRSGHERDSPGLRNAAAKVSIWVPTKGHQVREVVIASDVESHSGARRVTPTSPYAASQAVSATDRKGFGRSLSTLTRSTRQPDLGPIPVGDAPDPGVDHQVTETSHPLAAGPPRRRGRPEGVEMQISGSSELAVV